MSFDELIDRTGTKSARWRGRGDTLALTVGDSDFRLPPPVRDALIKRLDEGVVGYDGVPDSLRELIIDRMLRLYDWQIKDEWLVFLSGVVPGFNFCCRGLTSPGDAIISETPIYYPFLSAPSNADRALSPLPALLQSGRWSMDLDGLAKLAAEPRNKLLLFCNPQNPLGRVSTRDELLAMADICVREQVPIVSDEIHCDLLYDGNRHIPIASLAPEIADITVTLMSATKAFGISGIGGAFAVIPNPVLRAKLSRKNLSSPNLSPSESSTPASHRDWYGLFSPVSLKSNQRKYVPSG
ncbi:MAG: aminotransferase class I/II-fold pyridoxal phosphate-dependent enzyme, partial [Gammaproteobacteria bacterium]|nr:aminotransferase class I/II-fold pyridoxal phosphate-dependent enzyme [Gammaproteobacteria bacterium]